MYYLDDFVNKEHIICVGRAVYSALDLPTHLPVLLINQQSLVFIGFYFSVSFFSLIALFLCYMMLLQGTQYHNAVQKFVDVCKLNEWNGHDPCKLRHPVFASLPWQYCCYLKFIPLFLHKCLTRCAIWFRKCKWFHVSPDDLCVWTIVATLKNCSWLKVTWTICHIASCNIGLLNCALFHQDIKKMTRHFWAL